MTVSSDVHGASRRSEFLHLALAGGLTVFLVFAVWEGMERSVQDDALRFRLHYVRGGLAAVLTALVVGLGAYRQHSRHERRLASELAERTRQAREAETLLQVVVDNTPAGLVVLDRDLRVVRANRVAERVHGAELQGTHCFDSLAGRRQPCESCSVLDTLASGASTCREQVHTDTRTGEVMSVEAHPLHLPDGGDYVLLVERVITHQKKLQARLLHQEKMAAFGLLAAGVAHDMGNPLASIEVQLQLLDDQRLNTEEAGVITTVRQEVGRLRRILREMVDLARRRREEASLVSVQAVVKDALRLLRHDPRMRHVKVVEEFDPETPSVFVVEDHLMQVVLNLLINSLDAMSEGGELRVEIKPIREHVVMRVHDTGVGMDRHVLAHCFEPLFTTKAAGKGTGLGLSVSRDIVRSAGGEIELHSAPHDGTIVLVTLPAAALEIGASVAPPPLGR